MQLVQTLPTFIQHEPGSIDAIIADVARQNGSSRIEVMSTSRARRVSNARRAAIVALSRARPKFNSIRIAAIFGLNSRTIRRILEKARAS